MENNKNEKVKSFFDATHIYLHKDFGVRVRTDIAYDLLGAEVIGKRLIDLGCGNGNVSLQFIDKVQELDFLDISDKMLDLVKEKISDSDLHKVNFFNCDLEEFKIDKKYDIIIAYGLLMHVNSPLKSLEKIYEMLNPGGLLLTQYTNCGHPMNKINKLFSSKSSYELNDIDEKLFHLLIFNQGFQIVTSFKYSLLLKGLGRLPDQWLYRFHKWTYENKLARKLGMDNVYLLTK